MDWHVHFRDDEVLKAFARNYKTFWSLVVMPNLIPPILNGKDALQYKKKIEKAIPKGKILNHS